MVEYGNGISNGGAGQAGGAGGSSHPLVTGGDPFANASRFFEDGLAWLQHLSVPELVLVVGAVLLGLFLIRRVVF